MLPKISLGVIVAACGVSVTEAFDKPVAVTSPPKLPVGASSIISHDFASFSFPAHFFTDFTGNLTHPNLFSRDIFQLLHSKSGAYPYIRVGGTSTDRVWYNASQALGSVLGWDDPNSLTARLGIADWVYIGPAFFEGFLNFPGTRWSWQINMGKTYGKPGGLDNAMEVASLVMEHCQDRLDRFEIGNEPELFVTVGHRTGDYTVEQYVDEWNQYAANASERVLKGNKWGLAEKRFFQALTFYGGHDPEWNIQDAFAAGMDEGGYVKSITYHQYANGNSPWVRLQNSYMNHTANRDNVTQYSDAIEFAHAYNPSLPLVLGETNSNSYNLNMSQIEGVFGSALFLIDHLLIGMVANVTRYNLIQGTTFGYSAWVPFSSGGRQPYVRAPLYGQIFVNDVLGHHPEVQVYEVPQMPWNFSAYGIYESGSLAKYVVINFDEWNSTTPYPRPTQEVTLSLPDHVRSIQVQRLTGNGASADQGIQWAGNSWNYTNGRLIKSGNKVVELYTIEDGQARLSIHSTEAVLVSF